VSAWLERLHTLVPAPSANSNRSDRSDSSPNGPIGPIGPGIASQSEVSESGPIAWHQREEVRLVVEDLFSERWHPHRIARDLGLTRAEVRSILRGRS
jgi:hypothetical protein